MKTRANLLVILYVPRGSFTFSRMHCSAKFPFPCPFYLNLGLVFLSFTTLARNENLRDDWRRWCSMINQKGVCNLKCWSSSSTQITFLCFSSGLLPKRGFLLVKTFYTFYITQPTHFTIAIIYAINRNVKPEYELSPCVQFLLLFLSSDSNRNNWTKLLNGLCDWMYRMGCWLEAFLFSCVSWVELGWCTATWICLQTEGKWSVSFWWILNFKGSRVFKLS